MSVDGQQYRIVTRGKAAALLAAVAIVGGLLLWFALGWVEAAAERTLRLIQSSPRGGAAEMASQLRLIGIVNGLVLCSFAAYLGWFAYRGIKTASVPPVGSWVLRGRKILSGRKAVLAGRWLLGLAGVLAVAALGLGLAAWRVAGQLEQIRGPTEQLENRALASTARDGDIPNHTDIQPAIQIGEFEL